MDNIENVEDIELLDNSEIQNELKTIHQSQSKTKSFTLLIITLIFFFSSGIISTSWQEILILIFVLLVHELGHLLTMKLLRYHDVKMFFIPFLGAAVSGKAKNETAFKSCIVSLMGPFPGIILGVIFYLLFGITQNYYLLKTSQVMLLLNAFNLLPVMPMDGGRFIDVLFVNNRYFRLIFSVIGALFFFLLAITGEDFFLLIIGVFSLIGAFSNFKVHGLTKDLKTVGVSATNLDDLLKDENELNLIITLLRKKYVNHFKPQLLYKAIYNKLEIVIDTIKFVPAKIFTKISLLMVYPVVLLLAIGVTIFFMAINYNEKRVTISDEKQENVYAEKFIFGKLESRTSLDQNDMYHGVGYAFGKDTSIIREEFYYENGFRNGLWISKNENGEIIKQLNFDNGKLVNQISLKNGGWDTLTHEEMSLWSRFIEKIREIPQPLSSNYKHFE